MHISEGVLSAPVLVTGGVLAAAGTAVGLKSLDYDRIAQAAILSSSFFVAALIHVPVGPSSVHLILNGIVGLLLGWGAFPAILVALFLQAVFFQFGGLTVLGVNTLIMALPAVVCQGLFGAWIVKSPVRSYTAAFACGFCAVFFGTLLLSLALLATGEHFFEVAVILFVSHLPVMIIEGIITVFCVGFLKKVQPELLPGYEPNS